MKKIGANARGHLYVVNDKDELIGCITDGDIRRWIINGGEIRESVSCAMNTDPVSVPEDKRADALRTMAERKIASIAIVDSRRHLVDVLFSNGGVNSVASDALKGTPVIVMAGGRGTRLYPYTKILPKPLIPVGDVPIVERILNRFARYGADRFYMTVNYRKEMIKSYFSESAHDYKIEFVEEDEPLGTAGSIRLIEEKFDKPVIITNCDILIEAEYDDVMKYHAESGNDLTIVSSLKNTVIPYGVLYAKENGIITSMQEKPELSHFINTGMYVMDPQYISLIPKGKVFHMTELAEAMMKDGKRVGMYPIGENAFLDMGEFAEMKRMEERINAGFVE
ncbi:MAG: nucleotidyltransferase family protein [Lachnospiraceae bacterium]|nr:nucleotidyltransferase family protein [Lachnospiraceae bacterium]